MLGALLPATVSVAEAFGDAEPAPLLGAEEAIVARAVARRRQEFATARRCAREALARLGFPPAPILAGGNREPLWPPGVVGSITHCTGYRAAAVARRAELASIGIDAEPNEPLPPEVREVIMAPAEMAGMARLAAREPGVCWERLLFSAKESVYKAWFPLARRWLDFSEAEVVIDPEAACFTARLLVPGPPHGAGTLGGFSGRYAAGRGLVVTAVAVPA
jgi:enterobactin synthetase component D / holo-[acyl-carrier protein] synthase